MSTSKITYHDLRDEALAGRLPLAIGRSEEMKRLDRHIGRRINNNVLLVGHSGSGKTAFVYGWMRRMSHDARYDAYALVQLGTEHLAHLDDQRARDRYAEAFLHMPAAVLFIDDVGRELKHDASFVGRVLRLYKPLLSRADVAVIMTLSPQEHAWLEREHPSFVQHFETVHLKPQDDFSYERILAQKAPRLNARHRRIVPDSALREIVAHARRFPSLGTLPRSAIALLDESLSHAALSGQKVLSSESVGTVVEAKTGVPRARLAQDDTRRIKDLETTLNARIVDQRAAIHKISTTLQRASLGLRNPNRPLGSFLLLGPSGVGKTETAKEVAQIMFGKRESFTRIDMSEFQQEHTVGRLIGAPPGYVGYEEGGALTNALMREPYSLILLDEIEKAHPKVFDIFLQVLDDGRLTSGQNETVDARNAIFMATSNVAVSQILDAAAQGADIDDEAFVHEHALPILMQTFRPEFINRFDSVLVFKPLSAESLVSIAQLEIRKIEARFAQHRVRFDIDPADLAARVARLADPRFGARPVKRFIEETCETLVAQSLMESHA